MLQLLGEPIQNVASAEFDVVEVAVFCTPLLVGEDEVSLIFGSRCVI